ncbi:MAG: single-stranded DNA-binding protein [Anaerolineae bacterium]|nr:single-stranded DNA-binding protein [Anaerolineae bacterium]
MGSSLQFTITGFVGSAPTVRQVNDQSVASFSVAVSRKNGRGEKQTVWVRVNCWGKLADIAVQYLNKGSLTQISATWVRPNAWIDQNGNPIASLDIDANQLVLLDRVDNGNYAEEDANDVDF